MLFRSLGCVFGVVTLTWVFSGLVSMEPWAWTNAHGVRVAPGALSGGDLKLKEFKAPTAVDWKALTAYPVKQVEFVRVLSAPFLVADYTPVHEAIGAKRDRLHQPYNINGQLQSSSLLVDAVSGQLHGGFDNKSLADALDEAVGDAAITETTLLTDYDDYY